MIDFSFLRRGIPKESIELILLNIRIREKLKELWELYKSGNLEYDDRFEEIFKEIFKIFLRPLKLFLFGFETPKVDGIINAYLDFLRSYFEYLIALYELMLKVSTSLRGNRSEWRCLQEVFILPKSAIENLYTSLEEYDKFVNKYDEFAKVLKETYCKACDRFISEVKAQDFDEFVGEFIKCIAEEFDRVLKSEKYVNLQREMVESLMDYVYYTRRYVEDLMEYNPLNPFATVSMIDEAYKRIQDLKRRVDKLERIVYGGFSERD